MAPTRNSIQGQHDNHSRGELMLSQENIPSVMRCADSFLSCCVWSPFGHVDFDIWLENCQKRTIAALAWHTVLLAVHCVFNYMWICDSCCFGICETLPMTYCIHPCIDVPRHTQQRRWWTISLHEGMRARAHAHTRTRTFWKHVCEYVGINSLLCVLMACALKPFFGWSGRKKNRG